MNSVYQEVKDVNHYLLNTLPAGFGMSKTQYRKRPIVCAAVNSNLNEQGTFYLYMMLNSYSHATGTLMANPGFTMHEYFPSLFIQLMQMGTASAQDWRNRTTVKQDLHDDVLCTTAITFTILEGMLLQSKLGSRAQVELFAASGVLDGFIDKSHSFLYRDLAPIDMNIHYMAEDLVTFISDVADKSVVETTPGYKFDFKKSQANSILFLSNLVYTPLSMRILFELMMNSIVTGLSLKSEYDEYYKYLAHYREYLDDDDSSFDKNDLNWDKINVYRNVVLDFLLYIDPQFMKNMAHEIDGNYAKTEFARIQW